MLVDLHLIPPPLDLFLRNENTGKICVIFQSGMISVPFPLT